MVLAFVEFKKRFEDQTEPFPFYFQKVYWQDINAHWDSQSILAYCGGFLTHSFQRLQFGERSLSFEAGKRDY